MRIGIDVGGTNTDAVLLDGRSVAASVKTPTTPDVTSGIVEVLRSIIDQSALETDAVQGVMIGTTHFTNAVIEAKPLMPTAAVRLGLPATRSLRPMVDWPARLREAVGNHAYLCHGGHEFDGRAISPLDAAELRAVAAELGERGVRSVAICSVFSPVNAELEQEAGAVFQEELPGVAVSLSHEIGRVGLLERENATIMNACLRDLAERIVDAFGSALAELTITAPVYLSQNDGTLMSVERARRYPVATFASGPTNSMRGAAFLSGVTECAVVDIGGTTSDVGMLVKGFPRESAVVAQVGGVRTNFRMPDVLSIGLGGGSLVRGEDALTVGRESVGYRLTREALVFGGQTLTATDIAVAAGLADVGDAAWVQGLDEGWVRDAHALIERTVAKAVDRMKTSAGDIPVVVVGGGSILLGSRLDGASELIRPEHSAVANAIGAAIAQIGGEVDRVFSMEGVSRDEVLAQAKAEATEQAVAAGGLADSVEIVEIDEVPLAYLPSNAVRVRVKAVGDLDLARVARVETQARG
ncbi:MAG: hydantoinase/oxoprolinase family protein [Actinomycetia bacterium]|nr:hydantoinase/oxoprolinase family protein [Actinomycetes bacterium]